MVEGIQAAHHVKRSIGGAEVFDGIGHILYGMKVYAELAVGIDQRVATDPPTGVAGPFERSSWSTADVKDALSGEERPMHTEVLSEEHFEVLIAEHAILLGESSSPEVELCSGLVGRSAREPLSTCSEKPADVHTDSLHEVSGLCARGPFIDPCASWIGVQERGLERRQAAGRIVNDAGANGSDCCSPQRGSVRARGLGERSRCWMRRVRSMMRSRHETSDG